MCLESLIARVSGQPFGVFLGERIFAPLGMKDTAFHVPSDKRDRLATSYAFNRQTQSLEVCDGAAASDWGPEPPFESGGSGLVGTIEDYFAFYRMLLNKGRCGRHRVVSRASVELMASDQLTPDQRADAEHFFRSAQQLGIWRGGGYCAQRGVQPARPLRVGWQLRDDCLHRSSRRHGWDAIHPAHDGLAQPAEGLHGFLDPRLRRYGIERVGDLRSVVTARA